MIQALIRKSLRALAVIAAFAAAAFAAPAHAGCGTIVTLNPTDHWVWITIYDLGELQHLDWGWVAPHTGRDWHAGGAPTPQSYMCGSFYHVRYEVKQGRLQPTPPDVPNLFDTRMQINPQLTLTDLLLLFRSLGSAVVCVTGGEAGCAAEWGLHEGAETALLGAIGSESNNSVVCIKSSDDTHFWLENSGNCALFPPKGKAPPGQRPPPPLQPKYELQPADRKIGIGINTRGWYFNVAKDGQPIQDQSVYQSGRLYTDNPKIARFDNPHDGHIRGVSKGKTTAHWDYQGKTRASATIEVN